VRTIILTEKEKKEVLQCRSCNHVFEQSKMKREKQEHSGLESITATCPDCGSTNFGYMNYPVDEEFNTYKSKSFHKKDNRYKYNMRHYNINDFMFEEE
jgi:peptide subunit release factor 1 (eRF1)